MILDHDNNSASKDTGSFASSQVSIVKIKGILIMILDHDRNPASKDTGSFAPPQVSIKYNIP